MLIGTHSSCFTAWISLFNGKDLSGWKNNGDEKWGAESGTIFCESTANKYGYLTTEKTYRNFDLRLKFKPEALGNSGVFLRSKITGIDPEHGPDIEGMQVEVEPTVTVLSGDFDQSDLHALLNRLRGLGLELVGVRQAPPA